VTEKEQALFWLQDRPPQEQVYEATAEVALLLSQCKQDGQNVQNVKRVLEWVFISNTIPIEWLEQKAMEEIYGRK